MTTREPNEVSLIVSKAISVISSSETKEQKETARKFASLALSLIKAKIPVHKYFVYLGIFEGVEMQKSIQEFEDNQLVQLIAEEQGY
jgi:hypothetical protein